MHDFAAFEDDAQPVGAIDAVLRTRRVKEGGARLVAFAQVL